MIADSMPDDWESLNRRPATLVPTGSFCGTRSSLGWVPFDRKLSVTRHPMSVSLIIRCAACNADGRLPVPTPIAAMAILEGRVL